MWSKLKAIPVVPKIVIGCVVLLGIWGVTRHRAPQPVHQNDVDCCAFPEEDRGRQGGVPADPNGGGEENGGGGQGERGGGADSQLLAQYEAREAVLRPKIQECMQESQAATLQGGMQAGSGVFTDNQPPCMQYLMQWGTEETTLQTEIYRMKTGDRTSSVAKINGVRIGPSGGGGSYYRPSSGSNDGGEGAVENYSRQAIRGNSIYRDENGQEHELPTASYYYHDLESGRYVASESPNAPNDGHDYEPMTPQN